MDLLERLSSDVVAKIVRNKIESHVEETCQGSFTTSHLASLEEWLETPDKLTELVDMAKIDRVPVTFVLALGDGLCPTEINEYYFHQITAPDSYLEFERGGHLIFNFKDEDTPGVG